MALRYRLPCCTLLVCSRHHICWAADENDEETDLPLCSSFPFSRPMFGRLGILGFLFQSRRQHDTRCPSVLPRLERCRAERLTLGPAHYQYAGCAYSQQQSASAPPSHSCCSVHQLCSTFHALRLLPTNRCHLSRIWTYRLLVIPHHRSNVRLGQRRSQQTRLRHRSSRYCGAGRGCPARAEIHRGCQSAQTRFWLSRRCSYRTCRCGRTDAFLSRTRTRPTIGLFEWSPNRLIFVRW